ncbi:hypothetical protein T08_1909, partial [Trichinella sp. T8]
MLINVVWLTKEYAYIVKSRACVNKLMPGKIIHLGSDAVSFSCYSAEIQKRWTARRFPITTTEKE